MLQRQSDAADRAADRATAVLEAHSMLARSIIEMAAAQRAYLLTGVPTVLREYEALRERYDTALRRLQLVAREPGDAAAIERLEHLVDDWHRRVTVPLLQRRQQGADVTALLEREGLPRLERILEALGGIESEARRVLTASRDEARRLIDRERLVLRAVFAVAAVWFATLFARRWSNEPPGVPF